MPKAERELRAKLNDEGVALLRSFFSPEAVTRLRDAATHCFDAIEARSPLPDHYRFTPQAHSVRLAALLDFGIDTEDALLSPLSVDGLDPMFSFLMGGPWRCLLEHSWVRKKFAPRNAPKAACQIQDWHQDGALGAQFPLQPGPPIPATNLATCWIPLSACGRESPGLEFIRKPQPGLLHFTELDDAAIRRRFDPSAFWAPPLEFGDGLVFHHRVLHRTHVHSAMHSDRMSVEYRIFPDS